MSKYIVRIEGRTVLVKDQATQSTKRMGFFATRMLETSGETDATREAIELIKRDLTAQGVESDPDRSLNLTVDAITIVDVFPSEPPGKGFTFYPDEDN